MMKRLFAAIVLLWPGVAFAQATAEICVRSTPTGFCQAVGTANPLPVSTGGGGGSPSTVSIEQGGNTATVKGANTPSVPADSALVVSVRPDPGAVSTPGCTVGAASAQCLAGLLAARWLQLQNVHATNSVACSWGGTAVLNAASSFMLSAGQSASWGFSTGGVPNQALNCIASGAGTPLYVEYR